MTRENISELHCIMPTANLRSVMRSGILSHNRAKRINHASIALEDVQDRRRGKRVPGGRPLHDYANLYLHARNPSSQHLKEKNAMDKAARSAILAQAVSRHGQGE